MSKLDCIGVLGWSKDHHFLVLDLVGYIFTKLDTNVLLDFLLSDPHKIGSTMPAVVEDMAFKFLA